MGISAVLGVVGIQFCYDKGVGSHCCHILGLIGTCIVLFYPVGLWDPSGPLISLWSLFGPQGKSQVLVMEDGGEPLWKQPVIGAKPSSMAQVELTQ